VYIIQHKTVSFLSGLLRRVFDMFCIMHTKGNGDT